MRVKPTFYLSESESPASYNVNAHRNFIDRQNQFSFDAILCVSYSPCGSYLASGSYLGEICVWETSDFSRNYNSLKSPEITHPKCSLQVRDGSINCLRFLDRGRETLLFCGTDRSVLVWSLSFLLNSGVDGGAIPTPLSKVQVRPQTCSHPTCFPTPEINSISVDSDTGSLFAGCGDNKSYQWDIETNTLKRTFDGHKDYVLSIDIFTDSKNRMVTGANDGTLGIWDVRCSDPVSIQSPLSDRSAIKFAPQSGWISTLFIDTLSPDWICFGGGYDTKSRGHPSELGFLGRFYVPSRTLTTVEPCGQQVHSIVQSGERLYSVGVNSKMYEYESTNLSFVSQTKLNVKNAYGAAVCIAGTYEGTVAVCGRKPAAIDICIYPGSPSFFLKPH